MSRPTIGRRPPTVTLAVVLIALSALVNLALGVLVLVRSGSADPIGSLDVAQTIGTVRAIAVVIIVLAALEAVIALLLVRGVNGGRLAATLVLVVQQAHSWTMLDDLRPNRPEGFASLAVAVVVVFLLWNPNASSWFDRDREEALADSLDGASGAPRQASGTRVLDFVLRLIVLGTTIALTPGITVSSTLSLLVAVVAIAIAGWLLEPIFLRIALVFGWFGAVLLALFANAAVLGAGLYITPGIDTSSALSVFVAAWIYAFVMTLIGWAFSINSRDYLTVHAMRMGARGPQETSSDVPGVVFVQLDGVPAPLLESEIRSGNVPTISRWVRSGTHTWTEWTARVPSTTPVSQAGLLHGNNDGIPAFRWFDRDMGRLLVANRPEDAAIIEARVSNGRGLLADDGVSISNLFSGDAATSLLTMSGLKQGRKGLGPSQSYAAFFTHPAGILRAVIMTIGEMVKEVFQARRQVRRGVEPRIHRGGSYVALRAVTNVFLRDLNVALVVEAMMKGSKAIYVDFVDYDEIAHHAGVTRSESLAAFYGLDDVLRSIEQVIAAGITPRPYHVVLVSDHGQSQGATFLQRYGVSLEDLILGYFDGDATVTAATGEVEAWGPVNMLVGQLSGQDSVSGRITKRAISDRDQEAPVGPSGITADTTGPGDAPAEITVVGSGNLGGVWFSQHEQRLTLTDIERLHPGLLAMLAAHPGIGFVVVAAEHGPVALGADGTHDLTTGQVVGEDPLALFGPDAVGDFIHVSSYANAPDIYVNSLYDPVLDEVAAFEELVGCHGGLGGWQTRPLLVHPAEWTIDEDLLDERGRLRGADTVHHQMVRWLERLGHRTHLQPDAVTPATGSAPTADPVR
ncbi:MAG: alkaline phosphatase family protein [Ornithinibacter sp.]